MTGYSRRQTLAFAGALGLTACSSGSGNGGGGAHTGTKPYTHAHAHADTQSDAFPHAQPDRDARCRRGREGHAFRHHVRLGDARGRCGVVQ